MIELCVCAWCWAMCRPVDDQHGWRPAARNERTDQHASHGMCPRCFAALTVEIQERYAARAEVRP